MDYAAFLSEKLQYGADSGFTPVWLPDFLFDFQAALVEWATRKGRAALFVDCGLGKSPMALVWAENVIRHTGRPALVDFPGDILRLHERLGFHYLARYCVWKEPLAVRNRTMAKKLAHKTIVEDASRCGNASADYLLVFRRHGVNPIPIRHPHGLTEYAGERQIPVELLKYRGWTGNQIENRYSHWIWRQYASAFWDDVRVDRVLPFREARDPEDEKHVHPLQLDVIERCVILWSNEGETVLTPFMGVGSEVYGALLNGRRAIGIELKPSYYRQALRNIKAALQARQAGEPVDLFSEPDPPEAEL